MSDSNALNSESTQSASTRTPVVRPSNRLPFTAFKSRLQKQSSHEGKVTQNYPNNKLLKSAKTRVDRADPNFLKALERRPIGSNANPKKNTVTSAAKKVNTKLASSNDLSTSHPPKSKHSKTPPPPPKHTAKSNGSIPVSKKSQSLSSKDLSTAPPRKNRTLPIALKPPTQQDASKDHNAISPDEVVMIVYGKGTVNSKYKIPSKKRRSSDSPLSPTPKHVGSPSCNGTTSNHTETKLKQKTPVIDLTVKGDSETDDVLLCSPPSAPKVHVIKDSQQLTRSDSSEQKPKGKLIQASKPQKRQFATKSTGGKRQHQLHGRRLVQYKSQAVGNKRWVLKRYSQLRLRKLPFRLSRKQKTETALQGGASVYVKVGETAAPNVPNRKRVIQSPTPEVPSKRLKTDEQVYVTNMVDTFENELPSTCSRTVPFEDVFPLKCARAIPYTSRKSGRRTLVDRPARISTPGHFSLSSSDYVMESSDDAAVMSGSASVGDSMDGMFSDFVPTRVDGKIALNLESTSFSDLSSDEHPTPAKLTPKPPNVVKKSVSVTLKPHQDYSSTTSVHSPLSITSSNTNSTSHSSDVPTSISTPPSSSHKPLTYSTDIPSGDQQRSVVGVPSQKSKLSRVGTIGHIVSNLSEKDKGCTNDERTACESEKIVSSPPKVSDNNAQTEPSPKGTTNKFITNTNRRLPLTLQTPQLSTSASKTPDPPHSPILSPVDEEYGLRLQETINKFVHGGDTEPKSSRSSRTVSPEDDEGLSLVVKIKRSDLLHFPSLSAPTQYMGLTTETLGMYQSQGVQVDRGMIVDREILDKYVTVKISEALYEMNEELKKTEALVEQVMADKKKLEKLLTDKVQMIKDMTVTGFMPVLVDAETMTNDSHLQKPSTTVSGRAKCPKMKNVAVQTHMKKATNICLKQFDPADLEPYLRMRSATPNSTISEPDDLEFVNDESAAQEMKKQWMFKESEACSRCTAIRPQVRLMRALNNSVNSSEDKTMSSQEDLVQQASGTVVEDSVGWDMLGSTLQKLFEEVHSVYVILKNLSVETVLKRSASEVVSSVNHLLSHLPIPSTFVRMVQQDPQRSMSESTASYLLGWKMKELIILLKDILENGTVLPTFFKAELIQTQNVVHKTLEFASEGLRNETILHGSHGYMVNSNYSSSLPLRSHELPPLPMEPFFFYKFDDLDVDPYGSESSYSSLTSSDSEADERPLKKSKAQGSSNQEPKSKTRKKSTNPIRVRRNTDPNPSSTNVRKKKSKNDRSSPQQSPNWLQKDKVLAERIRKQLSKKTGPKKANVSPTCARISPTTCTPKRKGTSPNVLHSPVSASSTQTQSFSKNPITSIRNGIKLPDTSLPVAIASVSTNTSNSVASTSSTAASNSLCSPSPHQMPTVQQAVKNPAVLSSQLCSSIPGIRGVNTRLKNIAMSGRLQPNEVSQQQFVNVAQILQNKSKQVSTSNVTATQLGISSLPIQSLGAFGGQISVVPGGVNYNLISTLLAQTQGYINNATRLQQSTSTTTPSIGQLSSSQGVQTHTSLAKGGVQSPTVASSGPSDLTKSSMSSVEMHHCGNAIKTAAQSQNSSSRGTEATPTIELKPVSDSSTVQLDTSVTQREAPTVTHLSSTPNPTVSSQHMSVSIAGKEPPDVTTTPISHSQATILEIFPASTVAVTPTVVSVDISPHEATPVPVCGSKSKESSKSVTTTVVISASVPLVTAVSGRSSNAVTKCVSYVDTVSSTRSKPSTSSSPSTSQGLQNKCITPEFMQKLTSALSSMSHKKEKERTEISLSRTKLAPANTSRLSSQSKTGTLTDTGVTLTKPRLQPAAVDASEALPSVSVSLQQSKPPAGHPNTLPSVSQSVVKSTTTFTKPRMSPVVVQPVTVSASKTLTNVSTTSLTESTPLSVALTTSAMLLPPVTTTTVVCAGSQQTVHPSVSKAQTVPKFGTDLPKWTEVPSRPVTAVTVSPVSSLVSALPPLADVAANQAQPSSSGKDVLPLVQVSHSNKGLVVKWTFPDKFLNMQFLVRSYELFASSSNTIDNLPISHWAKVGSIKPLPLPMAVTMTNFTKGCYRFSVRALFASGYCSGYSQPCLVNLS